MMPVLILSSLIILGSLAGACSEPVRQDAREASNTLGPDDRLVIIVEDSLFGFVGMDGQVKVQPRFVEVGAFSEGRAAARETSLFGYIDRTGAWIIEPQFDFATDFSEGIAAVWVNGKVRIIDTGGTMIPIGDYSRVGPCKEGYLEVYRDEARGLITSSGFVLAEPGVPFHILDSTHVLVGDHVPDRYAEVRQPMQWRLVSRDGTVLRTITGYDRVVATFGAPVFLLTAEVPQPPHYVVTQYSVFSKNGDHISDIDTAAVYEVETILPCGHMAGWKHEYHRSRRSTGYRSIVLDHSGRPVEMPAGQLPTFSTSFGNASFIHVEDSRDKVHYVSCTDQTLRSTTYSVRDFQYKDLRDKELEPDLWSYRYQYEGVYGLGRNNGGTVVLSADGQLSAPLPLTKDHAVMRITKSRVFTVRQGTSTRSGRIEIFDRHAGGKPIATIPDLNAVLTVWDRGISVVAGGRQIVVNENGAIVWSSKYRARSAVRRFGYSFKPEVWRAGHRDSAAPIASLNVSDASIASAIVRSKADTQAIRLIAVAHADSSAVKVFVVNVSNDVVALESSDNRLYLVMEARRSARDPWTEIEYLPSSWCGNSYYQVQLPGRSFWAFSVERYEGLWPVECRMKLTVGSGEDRRSQSSDHKTIVVYSAPFTAAVNPAQLWRVRDHERMGLMDPY